MSEGEYIQLIVDEVKKRTKVNDEESLKRKIAFIISNSKKVVECPVDEISSAIVKAMVPDENLTFYHDIYFIAQPPLIKVMFSHNFMMKIALKSKKVNVINSYEVSSNDTVKITSDGLVIDIDLINTSGEFVGVFVVVKLSNGESKFNFVPKAHIEKARLASKAGYKGPWKTWYMEMAKKVAIKNTLKSIDISDDFERAIEVDNESIDIEKISEQKAGDAPSEKEAVENLFKESNGVEDKVVSTLHDRGCSTVEIKNGWVMFESGMLTFEERECITVIDSESNPGFEVAKLIDLIKCLGSEKNEHEDEIPL